MYNLNFQFNNLDSSYLNIFFGFLYSLPLNVPNIINFRHFILEGFLTGISAILGTTLGCFVFFSFIFNGNQSFVGFWHFVEPVLSLFGLWLAYRLASSFYQVPNETPKLHLLRMINSFTLSRITTQQGTADVKQPMTNVRNVEQGIVSIVETFLISFILIICNPSFFSTFNRLFFFPIFELNAILFLMAQLGFSFVLASTMKYLFIIYESQSYVGRRMSTLPLQGNVQYEAADLPNGGQTSVNSGKQNLTMLSRSEGTNYRITGLALRAFDKKIGQLLFIFLVSQFLNNSWRLSLSYPLELISWSSQNLASVIQRRWEGNGVATDAKQPSSWHKFGSPWRKHVMGNPTRNSTDPLQSTVQSKLPITNPNVDDDRLVLTVQGDGKDLHHQSYEVPIAARSDQSLLGGNASYEVSVGDPTHAQPTASPPNNQIGKDSPWFIFHFVMESTNFEYREIYKPTENLLPIPAYNKIRLLYYSLPPLTLDQASVARPTYYQNPFYQIEMLLMNLRTKLIKSITPAVTQSGPVGMLDKVTMSLSPSTDLNNTYRQKLFKLYGLYCTLRGDSKPPAMLRSTDDYNDATMRSNDVGTKMGNPTRILGRSATTELVPIEQRRQLTPEYVSFLGFLRKIQIKAYEINQPYYFPYTQNSSHPNLIANGQNIYTDRSSAVRNTMMQSNAMQSNRELLATPETKDLEAYIVRLMSELENVLSTQGFKAYQAAMTTQLSSIPNDKWLQIDKTLNLYLNVLFGPDKVSTSLSGSTDIGTNTPPYNNLKGYPPFSYSQALAHHHFLQLRNNFTRNQRFHKW